MSLWLPRTSQAVLSRSYSRIRVRSSIPIIIHTSPHRFQSSKPSIPTNATPPRPLDPSSSTIKPSLPTQKDATQAPLMARAWKKVKHEAAHYWNGTKLLVSEVRISSRLQWKILQGEALTRRERRQVLSILNSSKKCLILNFLSVETYYAGPTATRPFFRLHHRTIHGISSARCTQTLPEYATFHV